MKNLKRITAIIFAVLMVLGTIPLIASADTAAPEPLVTVDGLKVEISNLYDIHDLFISRGTYGTYRLCADNKVVRATSAKLAGGHSWSYVLPKPGDYTLCVRYVDGTQKFVHFTAEAAIPVFVADGLDLRITNLTGAKVVRTAKGKYATAGEVKRGENAKGFTPKTFNYADEYTFRFADEGEYTVAVQYENGYTHVEHVTLAKKMPTFTVKGGVLTISGLDGLYVIRYAAGEFTTIRDIKYTAGSKFIRPDAVTDCSVTIPGLHGQYTFAVQYTDGTVHVETLVIEDDPDTVIERYGLTFRAEAYSNQMPVVVPRPGYNVGARNSVIITVEAEQGGTVPDMEITGAVIARCETASYVRFGLSDETVTTKVFISEERDLSGITFENRESVRINLTVTIDGETVELTLFAVALVCC